MAMTDTPITTTTNPPATVGEQIKAFLGDLARPFAVYAVSGAEAWAIFSGRDAASIGAGGVVLAALFAAKTVEVQQAGKQAAAVSIAQAAGPTSTAP
jgi:hypothetical protein